LKAIAKVIKFAILQKLSAGFFNSIFKFLPEIHTKSIFLQTLCKNQSQILKFMPTNEPKQGHPKGLYFVFATAMSERFSYYGMRAIFTLYLIKALLMDKELASTIYGNYTGLVYLTPLIGGYVADRYLGMRKSILWGAILMIIGQLFMFSSALYFQSGEISRMLMYSGLAALIFGNGFFKPNITTMVGSLYEKGDKRLDSAYTIFYMGVNVGAFIAPLLCGFFGDTGNPADFKFGFLTAAIGMFFSLILFVGWKSKFLIGPNGEQLGIIAASKMEIHKSEKEVAPATSSKQNATAFLAWILGGLALFGLFHYALNFDIIGAVIFSICIIIPAYVISDKSLTKIEQQRIWVIYIIAFFVIFFWSAFEQAGASLTFFADEQTNRNIFGSILPGSWVYSTLSIFISKQMIQTIIEWKMPASYFQSFNPVFIVLMGLVFSNLWIWLGKRNMDPASPVKQSMGLFFLALGYLVIAFGVKNVAPGVKVSILWLTGLYFIHTMGELMLSPIGLSMVNKLAPLRFASLLMGVWYMSMATANKFAGMLSGLYPEVGKPKFIFGIQIVSLYDFFMLFVVIAGVASVILFGLSKWLQKLMNGVK
jgi:POT family proton-dependent oligopeptide transporter